MRGSARQRKLDGLLVGVLVLWAMLIQRPWRAVPPPVSDMGAILTTLHETTSVLDGTVALTTGFAREGRFMPGSMLALAAKEELFGSSGVDWRWAGFVVGAALVVAAYVALRRFRLLPLAAFVGASLFIYSDHASGAWLLPQVMEPLAAMLVIGATLIAMRYRVTSKPAETAMAISITLVAAIWVKEPLVAAVPFVACVALFWREGTWDTAPSWDRVRLLVIAIAVLVGVANIGPILAVRFLAENPDYAERYSASTFSLATLSNSVRASIFPVTRVPWFPANVAAVVIILLGVAVGIRRGRARQTLLWVAIPLLLPLSVGLIYAPWPSFPGYYALAGTFGLSLVIAWALTEVSGEPALATASAAAASAGMALLGTVVVTSAAATYVAERRMEVVLARHLHDVRSADILVFGTRTPAFSGSYGSSLIAYSTLFFGRSALKGAIDTTCQEAERLAAIGQPDTVIVTYQTECPGLGRSAAITVEEPVATRDWKTMRTQMDTLRATLTGTLPSPPLNDRTRE